MFIRRAARARHIGGNQSWDEVLAQILAEYEEPVPGARERIDKVLRIMLTYWIAVQTAHHADLMMEALE